MATLSSRIADVLLTTGLSKAALARLAGVTDASVTFWVDGRTHSLKGETAARLERGTGFRAAWLSTGRGTRLVAPSEEGDMLLPQEVDHITALRQLTETERERVMAQVRAQADHNVEVIAEHRRSTAKPPPKR